jgi:purine-cytosine permease-like protein
MTAILLSDFFILKQDHTADSINWLNLVLWVLGVILYRFLLNVDTPVGITVPVVVILMVISALVHKVLNKA